MPVTPCQAGIVIMAGNGYETPGDGGNHGYDGDRRRRAIMSSEGFMTFVSTPAPINGYLGYFVPRSF